MCLKRSVPYLNLVLQLSLLFILFSDPFILAYTIGIFTTLYFFRWLTKTAQGSTRQEAWFWKVSLSYLWVAPATRSVVATIRCRGVKNSLHNSLICTNCKTNYHANIITWTYIHIAGDCWHAYLAKPLQDFLHFDSLISHLWGSTCSTYSTLEAPWEV